MKKQIFTSILIAFFLTISLFAESTYKVQKGDTLYSISRKYQITVAELRVANNLKEDDVIKTGQKLVIPEANIGNAVTLSSSNKNNSLSTSIGSEKNYTVAKGDTVYSIAKKNGMTVSELINLNNLDSNAVIKVGQKLKIVENSENKNEKIEKTEKEEKTLVTEKIPDTRTYGNTVSVDSTTKWPVKSPVVTQVKGKVSGVQLSASKNESVKCIHEGTVMYVGVYRGFGQVVFVQTKTGLIYAYTGLGSVQVKKGEYLLSDSVIGTAGIDSLTQKSQITFMVFQNGKPINPATAPRS